MINEGTLVALATPAEFKAHHLQGHLLAVTCRDPLSALAVLRGLPGVSDVSLYGDSLHVLVGSADGGPLLAALSAAGIGDAAVQPIAPTLEDVFISLMKSR